MYGARRCSALSLLSPSYAKASDGFAAWMLQQERESGVYLSAVTVHEIEKGIGLLEHRAAVQKAAAIRLWLLGLVSLYRDRILPFTADVAKCSGELEALAVAAGHNPGASDAMIAGTAATHGLTVVTANAKHFRPFGITVLTPAQLADLGG